MELRALPTLSGAAMRARPHIAAETTRPSARPAQTKLLTLCEEYESLGMG